MRAAATRRAPAPNFPRPAKTTLQAVRKAPARAAAPTASAIKRDVMEPRQSRGTPILSADLGDRGWRKWPLEQMVAWSKSALRGTAPNDQSSRLCGRRCGAVAGALGAQLRPKRGRSASRGLPRAARRPGAPPRPRRRRPATLRGQRRSTEVNGAAEPRRLPLQVPRPPAAGRGDGQCGHGGRFEMPSGLVEVGELPVPALRPPDPAFSGALHDGRWASLDGLHEAHRNRGGAARG